MVATDGTIAFGGAFNERDWFIVNPLHWNTRSMGIKLFYALIPRLIYSFRVIRKESFGKFDGISSGRALFRRRKKSGGAQRISISLSVW